MQKSNEIKENMRDLAYSTIKNMIKTWELAPGDMVNEKALMSKLGLGRTPIREALNSLAQEKLTEVIPRRGTYISQITLGDIANLFQVREFMEPLIVSIATPIASTEMLEWFRENIAASAGKSTEEQVSLDNQFHRYLAAAANNSYIVNMMEFIYFQNERLRFMATRSVESINITIHDHLALIEAMLARDVNEATQIMREHIQYAKKIAMGLNIANLKLF